MLEHVVDFGEYGVGLLHIVVEPRRTFQAKTLGNVDKGVFVRTPDDVNIFGEFEFEGEESANYLQRMLSQVANVAQK